MEVDLTQSSQTLSEPVKLQRPFGKIRLLATDALGGNNKQEERPGEVTVDFKDAVIPSAFNALVQKVAEGATMEAGKLTFPAVCEDASVNNVTTGYENSYLLGYSYIFASGEIPSYSMDVEIEGNQGRGVIGTRSLSSIPVQANKLTTVIGNFYTNEGSIDVIVDDMFGEGEDVEELEDLSFPDAGVLNNRSNERYNTIAEAIASAEDGDVLTLSNSLHAETLNIGEEGINVRIVGQKETRVTAVYATKGTVVFENISFTGTQSQGGKSTVYVGGSAKVSLVNCVIDAPEDGETRPIASAAGLTGSFSLEGCKIDAKGANYYYLNAASESGKIVLKDNTFTGKGGTIEIMNSAGDNKVYPMVEGNNFGWLNPSFTYYSDPVITEQSQLDPDTKQYVSDFLSNNTVPMGIKVAPFGGTQFIITKLDLNITNQTTGKKYETIREAVVYAADGETIAIAEGNYDLGEPAQADTPGPNGYYLKVDKSLSIIGEGEVVITTSHDANSGVGSLQNLVTVNAKNVSFENITFKANYNAAYGAPNKIIEVRNAGFSISNCKFIPNDNAPEDCGSAVYFSQSAENGVVENCEINYAAICFDGLMKGNFTVKGNTFVEGNGNVAFTTPNWTEDDMAKSELYVTVEGNTFEGFEEYGEGVNPAVKVSYGILDLKDNQFPTGGIYWKAMPGSGINKPNFGSVFVDYDSVIDRKWTAATDEKDPKSFAISNDIVEMESTGEFGWIGRKASVNMDSKSSWEVTTTLIVTEDNNVNNAIELEALDVWLSFKRDGSGNAQWQYWDASYVDEDGNEGIWKKISIEGISVEPGEHIIKIAFVDSKITCFIDGITVYQLGYSSTAAIETINLVSFGYGSTYKTIWTYPVIKF